MVHSVVQCRETCDLMLSHQAFLEMDNHQEAMDMVNYYKKHTANMNGRPLTFYLSKDLMVIEETGPRPLIPFTFYTLNGVRLP